MNQTPSTAARTIQLLLNRRCTIATCESLTGGGIGVALTSVAGASAVFRGGLITYASDLKSSLAGVDAGFIAEHGVINERTAKEMAIGAAWNCRADIGLSCTGVAGPDGEDGENPGTVWLGLALSAKWDDRVRSRLLRLTGSRAEVREQTIENALSWLNECLREPAHS
ncbi:CinA family protein [Propionimicrobium sp. PCR01-08-3]|uniref:CinA family protein n=1 Tax=Propionimicrobium sp. PCR01-08-3 TaxID=3052086 RepID=UPI00255CB50B|nr:CinA family protein [Propionimicrobium sp. PCR01-08-3]WIY83641.1 CinA family protein [Propionimicrobium sp. PCR01-08-3]